MREGLLVERSLKERLAHVAQIGRVSWLGVRPKHDAPMQVVEAARCIADHGVEGDVAARGHAGGKRQITIIQAEHLPVIAALVGGAEVTAERTRRNVVVSGINLIALVRLHFAIGEEVILVGTGACAPCAKMDAAIGDGAFQAMRGHGGITARIERGGAIRVGDSVRVLPAD